MNFLSTPVYIYIYISSLSLHYLAAILWMCAPTCKWCLMIWFFLVHLCIYIYYIHSIHMQRYNENIEHSCEIYPAIRLLSVHLRIIASLTGSDFLWNLSHDTNIPGIRLENSIILTPYTCSEPMKSLTFQWNMTHVMYFLYIPLEVSLRSLHLHAAILSKLRDFFNHVPCYINSHYTMECCITLISFICSNPINILHSVLKLILWYLCSKHPWG
jgi:hypothetical protein